MDNPYLTPNNAKVGEGATICHYSDRTAYTIIKCTPTTITLQRDKVKRLDEPKFIPGGFAAHCINQHSIRYSYEKDPDGSIEKAYWSKKKQKYFVKGEPVISGRHEFYDYNF